MSAEAFGLVLFIGVWLLALCVLGAIADRIERADPRWPE